MTVGNHKTNRSKLNLTALRGVRHASAQSSMNYSNLCLYIEILVAEGLVSVYSVCELYLVTGSYMQNSEEQR